MLEEGFKALPHWYLPTLESLMFWMSRWASILRFSAAMVPELFWAQTQVLKSIYKSPRAPWNFGQATFRGSTSLKAGSRRDKGGEEGYIRIYSDLFLVYKVSSKQRWPSAAQILVIIENRRIQNHGCHELFHGNGLEPRAGHASGPWLGFL